MFHKTIVNQNPSDGCCKDYTEQVQEKVALTEEEIGTFFECVKKYHSKIPCELLFRIMLGTGCRIGEVVGLTWDNVDLDQRMICIDHEIQYRKINGKTEFYVKEPKTKKGIRTIPMTQEVYESFLKLQDGRDVNVAQIEINGYNNFVFTNANGKPLYPSNIDFILHKIVNRYNKIADKPLPRISNHIFRHTACTRMIEAGMDIHTVAYILGHTDVKLIMRVYDHLSMDRVIQQMKKLDTKAD